MIITSTDHLAQGKAYEKEIAYAFAAFASSFIEEKTCYAIHALTKLQNATKLPTTLLARSATWWEQDSPSRPSIVQTIDQHLSELHEREAWGIWQLGDKNSVLKLVGQPQSFVQAPSGKATGRDELLMF